MKSEQRPGLRQLKIGASQAVSMPIAGSILRERATKFDPWGDFDAYLAVFESMATKVAKTDRGRISAEIGDFLAH